MPVGPLRAPGDNAHAWVFQSFLTKSRMPLGTTRSTFSWGYCAIPIPVRARANPRPLWPRLHGGPHDRRHRTRPREFALEISPRLPAHTGMGFACYWSHVGYVAQVHQVSVHRRRHRDAAKSLGCGGCRQAHRQSDNAEHQIIGSIIDGMSAAFGQQITFENGRVVQSNYHNYTLLRNRKIPPMHIDFIKTDYPPTGLGEPAYPSALPALCNAIFAACGRRVRKLPLSATSMLKI